MVRKPLLPGTAIGHHPAPGQTRDVLLRLPRSDRSGSALYTHTPGAGRAGTTRGQRQARADAIEDGYAVIQRANGRGDRVGFVVPMAPQRIKADRRVAAGRGRVALRYGPLIYNIESVDGQDVPTRSHAGAGRPARHALGIGPAGRGHGHGEGAFSDLDRR
ncbi:MAG: glycoside hydrolase family 127 protein [Kiritimatiellia bacterium]